MSTTYDTGSTLGVLARQEIRNYLRHKLFWFGSFEKSHESSAISVSTPYFPSVTTWPAPYDERSSSVRVAWSKNSPSDLGVLAPWRPWR